MSKLKLAIAHTVLGILAFVLLVIAIREWKATVLIIAILSLFVLLVWSCCTLEDYYRDRNWGRK